MMCGITGFWSSPGKSEELAALIEPMARALFHRGPDDGGAWADGKHGIALGQRRLSIIDLSPEGHQPMGSASGRYVMVFNGEVFNFEELRTQLDGVGWHGRSDTEVMLAAIEAWGLETAVTRFVGMFAFALWDSQERKLHLVRDRLGIKPLYYGWSQGALIFGSELKAVRRHPAFHAPIDPNAVASFLRHNYIPAPHTIHSGFYKLAPGAIATFHGPAREGVRTQTYWSMSRAAQQGYANPYEHPDAVAIEELHALLKQAVGLRMVSDVPIGAFLSGGIDSSLVVALMQAQSARPVKTFSIGFTEPEYNEAGHAARVARHLGTEHTELYLTAREAQEAVPRLASMYDEPFADSSQLPTFLVSQLTRKHVTVSLSGDGGDELFAGYTRYHWVSRLWRAVSLAPAPLRRLLGMALTAVRPSAWDTATHGLESRMPGRDSHAKSFGNKVYKLGQILGARDQAAFYRHFISHLHDPEDWVLGADEPQTTYDSSAWRRLPGLVPQMMCLDTMMYLPDDILVKVDRASMAVSLEARVPLLDHRVVEFAWRLPMSLKIREGKSKWILRQILHKYVPAEYIERPKMGFGVPVGEWLRGPLRAWAEDLLSPDRLRAEGLLNAERVRAMWAQHLSGTYNWQYELWNFTMLQAWLESSRNDMGALPSSWTVAAGLRAS